jgi:hypothetical protein
MGVGRLAALGGEKGPSVQIDRLGTVAGLIKGCGRGAPLP